MTYFCCMKLVERRQQATKIREFFLSRPELRPSFFEEKCGIPATTLSHLVNNRRSSLKIIYLNRLHKTLAAYGFTPN